MKRRPKARKVIVHQFPIYHRPDLEQLEKRSYLGSTLDALGMGLLGSSLAFLSLDQFDQAMASNVALRHLRVGGPAVGSSGSADPYGADASSILMAHVAAWPLHDVGEDGGATTAPAREVVAGLDGDTLPWDDFMDGLADPADGAPHAPFHFSADGGPSAGSFTGGGGSGGVAPGGAATSGVGTTGPLVLGGGGPTEAELTSMLDSSALSRRSTPSSGASQPPATATPAPASPVQTPAKQGSPPPDGNSGNPPPPTGGGSVTLPPHLPLRFETNLGQKNAQVQFASRERGYNLFLTATEMVLALDKPNGPTVTRSWRTPPPAPLDRYALRMQFVGASSTARLTGTGQLGGSVNYLLGNNSANWLPNVATYGQVSYAGLYPGISVLYYGNPQGQIEYDFTVAPGASPATIQLAIAGAQAVYVDQHGNLVMHTPFGDVVEHAPITYQTVNGVRQGIESSYVLSDPTHVGFQVGAYDHTLPLVIDPSLGFSTFLGGSDDDEGNAVALDSSGNIYLTGLTRSVDFPTTSGVIQGGNAGSADVFVSKFSPDGQRLLYSTYLGGAADDVGLGIAVDGAGDAYVTGYTKSNIFPTTTGAFQNSLKGSQNAFVAKLSPNGQTLLYSTYLGGGGSDSANGIAVDSLGNAFVTGQTSSMTFPTTMGAFRTTLMGSQNAFVSEINTTGSALVYSTYLGGGGSDAGNGIAVDGSDNAYVTGSTTSTNFPTANGFQMTLSTGATSNAFLTKVNAGGGSLAYSTYLGGSGTDSGNAVALDSTNNAYVTGSTSSSNFPLLHASQGTLGMGASKNAFVTKVAPPSGGVTSAALVYSTYLGGSGADAGNGIAVNSAGVAYVTGSTTSANFPTLNGIPPGYGGNSDAFVAKFAAGTIAAPAYATYLGGSNNDYGTGIAVDGNGNAYVTGYTASNNFPILNAYQSKPGGGVYDAFLTKVSNDPLAVNLSMYNPVPTTEGTATGTGTRKLASFTFTSGYQLTDFRATINWGDGLNQDTVGTISPNGVSCGADVFGSHHYPEEGSYEIQVTITHNPTGAQVTGMAGILVLDAPLTGIPASIGTTYDTQGHPNVALKEGMALGSFTDKTLTVASFTDADTGSMASQFTAAIDWGDGHASAGAVQCAKDQNNNCIPGLFNVQATTIVLKSFGAGAYHVFNIYAHAGVYPVKVLILDQGGAPATALGGSRLTVQSTVSVGNVQPWGSGAQISVVAFSDFQRQVATFYGNIYDHFIASINWGDGSSSAGIISEPGGIHAANATWDPYVPDHPFGVFGYHWSTGYSPVNTPPGILTITITDVTNGTSVSLSSQMNMLCPAPCDGMHGGPAIKDSNIQLTPNGPITGTEGGTYTWTLASVSTTYGSFDYEVDWGDIPSEDSSFSSGIWYASQGNQITGTHSYAKAGNYTVNIWIGAGGAEWLYASLTAVITDPPISDVTLTSSGPAVTSQNQMVSGTVMTFTDPYSSARPPEFNYVPPTIYWGDGPNSYSNGSVLGGGGSVFNVTGSHTYGATMPTSEVATVVLKDFISTPSSNTAAVAFFGTIQINQPMFTGGTIRITPNQISVPPPPDGLASSGITLHNVLLATFTDPTPEPLANYQARIDWGDGFAEMGSITPGLNGTFYVYGEKHNYQFPPQQGLSNVTTIEGSFTVQVQILKDRNLAAQTNSTVRVGRAGVAQLNKPVVAEFYNSAPPFPPPTNYDPIYDAAFNWEDGSPRSADENYQTTLLAYPIWAFQNLHIFREASPVDSYVQYFDTALMFQEGRVPQGMVVAPALTAVTATVLSPIENSAYPGVLGVMNQPLSSMGTDYQPTGSVALATFANADPARTPGTFKATIFWGDNTQSPGAIQGDAGNAFTVLGSHTYHEPGTLPITVLIQNTSDGQIQAVTRTKATIQPDMQVHQRLPGTRLEVGTDGAADGGQATVAPNSGALQVYQPLDFRLSHDPSQDGFIDVNGNPLQGMTSGDDRYLQQPAGASPGIRGFSALVYSSDSVSPRPIGEVYAYFDRDLVEEAPPQQISVQMIFNGYSQGQPQAYTITGHKPGDTYVFAAQFNNMPAPLTQSGAYPWTIKTIATYSDNSTQEKDFTGNALVVDNDQSQFGAGWTLDGLNQLVITASGALMTYGSGAAPRLFALNICTSSNTFISPPDDFGTLTQLAGTYLYTYRSKYGIAWTFDATNTAGHSLAVLTSITDPHGLAATFLYDPAHPTKLTSIQWPDGGTLTVGNVTNQVTLQETGNRLLTLTFDPAGTNNLTGITDVDNSFRTFTYDSPQHHLINENWQPVNATFTYDATTSVLNDVNRGQGTNWALQPSNVIALQSPGTDPSKVLATLTNPRSFVSTYVLDFTGWLTQLNTPDGSTQLWGRSLDEQVDFYTDGLSRSTIYQYGDGNGDLRQVSYPDGSNEQFQYDSTFHRRTLYQDGNQNVTQYGYNSHADLTTITNAVNSVTTEKWYEQTTPALNGLLASYTDALNRTTSFQYYSDGSRRLQIRYNALGGQTSMLYDAVGNVTQITDARGNPTHFTADARGRLLTRTDAAGNIASNFYDGLGNVTGTVDADTNRTTFLYDGLGRKTVTIDAATNRTTALYDAAGNVTEVQGPLTDPTTNSPQLVSFSYDSLNRPVERTEAAQFTVGNPLRRVTTTLYDAVGNVTGILSPAIDGTGTRLTSFAYDGLNRQIGRTDAAQPLAAALRRSTATQYDLAGNVTQVTDADGHSTRFLYDALNRQTVTIDALSHLTTTLYDPVGNVTGIYSPAIDATGVRLTSFLYDALNRRTFMTESATTSIARTTSALYDAVGNVTETFDANGNPTQFLYDNLNRQTVTIDALGNRATTVYDGVGNITSVTSPSPDGNPLGRQTTFLYDALNRRVATTEAANIPALSRTSTVLYDALGNVTGQLTPKLPGLNNQTQFLYDALHRRTVTIDALGHPATATYDLADNVIQVSDANGNPTQFQYDALSRQTVAIDALGNRTTTLYDPLGNVTGVYSPSPDGNPQGRLTYFLYDALNRRVQSTEAVGTPVQRTSTTLYDAAGDVILTIDALGRPTQYLYDSLGRRTVTIDALTNRTTSLYDAANNVTGVYDQLGRLTSYLYDKLNRRVATTEAATNSTLRRTMTVLYDGAGDVTGTQGPLTDPTAMNMPQLVSFSYDALGRQTGRTAAAQQSTNSPLRQVTTMLYDIVGNLTGVYSPSPDGSTGGQLVSYSYDALNRHVETTEAATNASLRRTSTMLYDAVGNVTVQITPPVTNLNGTAPLNNRTTFLYDALNRKTVTIDPGLNRATVLYDGAGDVTSSTDVLGHQTTFSYDALGRRVETTQGAEGAGNPLRRVSTNLYDAVGNVTGTLSPLGASGVRLTSFLYDALNRQVETTVGAQLPVGNAQRQTTTTIYDPVGNVLVVVDAHGYRTSYLYDDLNRQTVTIDANTNRTTVLYDAANNVTQITDRDGRVRQFLYDALNRRTKEIWLASGAPAGPVATFSYDYNAANELIDASDQVTGAGANTSNYTFTFDALGRESQIASTGSMAPTITLQQNFDPADERTTLTALINGTNDFANTYLFDALGRMTNIFQTTKMMGVTVMRDVQLGYYADGSFRSIKEFQDANATQLVLQTSYGAPDSLGRLTSLQEGNTANPQPVALYTLLYDASDRLTQLNISNTSGTYTSLGNRTYTYDAVDELTGVSNFGQQIENYNYDSTGNRTSDTIVPGNRISFDGTYTYMYDAEGNRISRMGNGTTTTYIWDSRNRLIEVQTSGTTNSDVTFTYDVFDRRTSESMNGVMQEFAYDGNQVIEMFSGSGASATQSDRMLYGPKEDQLLVDEQPQGNVDLWPVVDYEGSVVNYVYDSGAAEYTTIVSYNSFGKTSLANELQGDDAGYTGQQDDTGTGLYYYKARYYDPVTGTFINEDPEGFDGGDTNLYRYVHNSPVNATDAAGLEENKLSTIVRPSQMRAISCHCPPPASASTQPFQLNLIKSGSTLDNTNLLRQWVGLGPSNNEWVSMTPSPAPASLYSRRFVWPPLAPPPVSSGPVDSRRLAGMTAVLLLQQGRAPAQGSMGPSIRALSPEEIQRSDRYRQRLAEATKEWEAQLRGAAYLQRSVYQGYPADSPVNLGLIDWANRMEQAEAAQQRASLSQGQQVVLFALEQVLWGLAFAALGEFVAAGTAGRGLSGAEAAEFIKRNPGSVEKAIIDGFESQFQRSLTPTEQTQLTAALRDYMPKAQAQLAELRATRYPNEATLMGPTSFWEYTKQAKGVGSFDYSAPIKPRGNPNDVVVYWVIDTRSRQVLKVGDTTVGGAVSNWRGNTLTYARRHGVPRENLRIEYTIFDESVPRHAPYDPETLLRNEFRRQGHKLPWDREGGENPADFPEAP